MDRKVEPNQLYTVRMGDEDLVLSAAFDRIDFFDWLGQDGDGYWILKVSVDGEGIRDLHITDPETILRLATEIHLPIVEREFIYEREYDGYLEVMGMELEEIFDEDWDTDGDS